MSWLFSQALVEECSAGICLAGEPSAQLSVMPTQHPFWRNGKTMEPSGLSRFGLTWSILTASRGEELLTSFRAAFHAKTSAHRDRARESMASDPASGEKWPESSVRYDLASSSWRTHRCLWDEALPWSSVTLPRWGMTRRGVVYQHPNSGRHTNAIAPGWSGETLPTPSVAMHKGSSLNALTRIDGRSRLRNRLDYWVERDGKNGRLNPEFVEWVMGWPAGWTALEPLATDKFQGWLQQHSPYSQMNDQEAA
jgi:hypothetical protein